MRIWFLIFALLPLVGMAYALWHIWMVLPLANVWKAAVVLLAVAGVGGLFLSIGRQIDEMPLWMGSTVYEIGTSSIFVLLYVVMAFLVLDLGRLCRLVPHSWLHANGVTSLVLFVGLVGLFVYGNINYRHKVRQELTVTTDKPLRRPLRIVMASDLHIGYHNRRAELHRWVDMLNKEKADLILVAGDIIDGSMRPLRDEQMHEEFLRLNAPVYACLGNHEYFSGQPDAELFYRQSDIRLLRDTLTLTDAGIAVVGRDDRTNPHRKNLASIMKSADKGVFTILLDHQPYHLEQAETSGIDFQFSGHTHHGQVWPISWITDAIYEKAFGSHQRGRTRYYVTSGLGIWGGKFRIGTRSEYVVMELTSQN